MISKIWFRQFYIRPLPYVQDPCIVYVLPAPVYPYAKTPPLNPFFVIVVEINVFTIAIRDFRK